ncbi:MAG: hypothetical protein WBX25_24025 [Rhodomicrobium sp.]
MASNRQEFRTAIFEDGTCAVLRADPTKPRLLEMIATFHDAAHARDYVNLLDGYQEKPVRERPTAARRKQVAKARPAQVSAAAKPTRNTDAKPKLASGAKVKQASRAKPTQANQAKPKTVAATDMSDRQQAVLRALRSKVDKKNLVEVTSGELAKASAIPLGSVHSVLVSLEKKGIIRTERQGSAKFRAIYEVLDAARKGTRSLNGSVHAKEAQGKPIAH